MKKGLILTILATVLATGTFTSNTYAKENKKSGAVRTAAVKKSVPELVVQNSRSLVGVPYRFGGNNTRGFDCSGFVSYTLNISGYDVPRYTAYDYWTKFKRTSTPQPGDLVLFKNTYKAGPSHVGIYIGGDKFVHSASNRGVIVSDLDERYYQNHFLGFVEL
jgi:cell wall-associated NlpC family hydrolase